MREQVPMHEAERRIALRRAREQVELAHLRLKTLVERRRVLRLKVMGAVRQSEGNRAAALSELRQVERRLSDPASPELKAVAEAHRERARVEQAARGVGP